MLLQRYFPLGTKGASGSSSSGMTVALSRTDIYKYLPTAGATATTVSVTATPSGGTGPYTYAWAGQQYITATTPTAAATTFQATGRGIASDDIEFLQCAVTDSLGAVAYNSVIVEIQIGGLSK